MWLFLFHTPPVSHFLHLGIFYTNNIHVYISIAQYFVLGPILDYFACFLLTVIFSAYTLAKCHACITVYIIIEFLTYFQSMRRAAAVHIVHRICFFIIVQFVLGF